jgi:hypothetical protein
LWPFSKPASNSVVLDRLENLERSFKGLQGEWDDHYDKQRRMLSRIVKQRAMLEAREPQDEEVPTEPMTSQEPGSRAGFLTPKQKLIQQQILQRRTNGRS